MRQELKHGDTLGMKGGAHADLYNIFKYNPNFQKNFSEGLCNFIISGLESIGTGLPLDTYLPEQIVELYNEFQNVNLSDIHVGNYNSYPTFQYVLNHNNQCTDVMADLIKDTINILFYRYHLDITAQDTSSRVKTLIYSEQQAA